MLNEVIDFTKMSAIRERTTLCVVDLPRKLTSRRNLHAHFQNFGKVKHVSVDKDLKTGMIKFSSHFEAQSAKTQGKLFQGKPLNIYWSESTTRDPRAKEEQDTNSSGIEQLWDDDDKECFGVEYNQGSPKEERKQSTKDVNNQRLKMFGSKLKLSHSTEKAGEKMEEGSHKSSTKLSKMGFKTSAVIKKSILNPSIKRKIVGKEETSLQLAANKQKKTLIKELSSKKLLVSSNVERLDLKQKLQLLDERDKLIRKGMIQNSNINTAVAIKGTCPDMCPERERILRQWGHAVATYELIPGTNEMDENKAVKEYIRSSADQEVPLPHDLRPEPVLSRTMNYLITNIITRVDNTDENKAVWYSFCWNRLRSIRKDIILQQLCDVETVTIVEQCARFHICCYDHMWGAEVSGFDDKINTQNLIDCLQTLKHMYEDLSKHGVRCNNEPEFYSYLILLKLKSGDVMWEYQQYTLDIQLSEQVQFAIEAYMAFKNNMYSRYFNLVNKASYLTACLMQRYFDEVRTQALKTMLRAYCLPNKSVGLSSSFIVSSLKFDSTKNALRFCEQEEVDVKVDSDGIEDVYVSTSSFLIREKRLPIANAVVGPNNRIPEYIPIAVCSSFDELGKLRSSSTIKSDDIEGSNLSNEISNNEKENLDNVSEVRHQAAFKFSLSPINVPGDIFGKTLFSNHTNFNSNQSNNDHSFENIVGKTNTSVDYEKIPNTSLDIEENLVEDMICEDSEISQEPMPNILQISKPVGESLKSQSQNQPFFIPSLAPFNQVTSFSKENETIKRSSPSVTRVKDPISFKGQDKNSFDFSFSFPSDLMKKSQSDIEVHDVELSTPTESCLSLESDTDNQNSTKRRPIEGFLTNDILLGDHMEKLCQKDGLQDISDNKECRLAKETEFNDLLLEKILKEKADQERLQFEENQKLEKIKKDNEEKSYYRFLRKDVRQRCKAISARKCARLWRLKIEKVKKTRADFPFLFQLSVKDHVKKWGIINAVPTEKLFLRVKNQRNTKRIISQLLMGKTNSCRYLGSDLAEKLAQSAARTMEKASIKPVYWKLAFSVPITDNSHSILSVFNQLMKKWVKQSFYKHEWACLGSVERVVTSLEIPVNMSVHLCDAVKSNHELQGMNALMFVVVNDAESDNTCVQRLRNLLSNQINCCEFSVVVMSLGGSELESVLELELQRLQEQSAVAHWKICAWSNPNSIVDSLHFLADQVSVVPHIRASSLEVLIKQVSEEFFDALSCNQHYNEALSDALTDPNNVIRLYNICLTKLEDILKSSKLEKYFNFAEDFRGHITMNESGGPELLCGRHYDNTYINTLTELMECLKLPEFSNWPARSSNRLVKMIKTYCSQVQDFGIFPQIIRMIDLPDEGNFQQHLQHVQWLNIIEIWAQCLVRVVFCSKYKSKRLFVIYNKNNVENLIQKQWWLKLPLVKN